MSFLDTGSWRVFPLIEAGASRVWLSLANTIITDPSVMPQGLFELRAAGKNMPFCNFTEHKIVKGLQLGLFPHQLGGWSVFQVSYSSGAGYQLGDCHQGGIQISWYQDGGYQNHMIFMLQEKPPHQPIWDNSGYWRPLGTPATNPSQSPP